uniref:Uncharacterized protein n=1 Tax=Callorhinchus milii TaxID=7868 RepID=A0A4W3HQ24_CALMI
MSTIRQLSSDERIQKLSMFPMGKRRLREDLIERFKIIRGINKLNSINMLDITTNSTARGTDSSSEESPEEQLQREVDWCIEQLELGLRTQKSNQKQAEEALRAVRTLRSKKAPLVKKRQLMRLMFGDYRKKMEVDWQRQLKLMETAAKCASIKTDGVTPKGKVFRKCATQSSKHSQESCTTDSQTGIRKESGFFQTGQGEFCFNFF